MELAFSRDHRSVSAIIGFALLSAPLAAFAVAVLEHYATASILSPFIDWISSPTTNLVSPTVFLGSLTAAFALNIYALLHIRIHKADKTFVGTIASSPRMSNVVAAALVSASTLTVPLRYAAVENTSHSSHDSHSTPNAAQEIETQTAELPPATPCSNC